MIGLRSWDMQIGRRARLLCAVFSACMMLGTLAAAFPGQYAGCPGSVVLVATGKPLSFDAFAKRVQSAEVVLFGEVHGARGHARASACLLSMLAEDERPTGLVMEILSVDDQPAIDRYRKDNPEDAAGLGVALEWWKRAWPAFDNWLPLLDRAFALKIDITGGDAGEGYVPGLRLETDLAAIQSSWAAAMKRAYCGLIDDQEAARLGEQQIVRDMSMAEQTLALRDRLTSRSNADAGVLIHVGRGHVRKDRSLFSVLEQQTKGGSGKIVSIGAFASGDMQAIEEVSAFDYVWLAGDPGTVQNPCSVVGSDKTEQAGE